MRSGPLWPALLASGLVLTACSAQLEQTAAPIRVTAGADEIFRLQENVTLKARHAAPVELRAGTRWTKAGEIEQGIVYETRDQVVIVNSFDVHEAAIVVASQSVVGFYLKIQNAFVAASPVPIILEREETR